MGTWQLKQFRNIVDLFYAGCDQAMQNKLDRRLDLLRQKGIECRRPITAPLGDGLFELRAGVRNMQARLIFFYGAKQNIIFVHAINKQRGKIDQADLTVAKKNRKKIVSGTENENGLTFIN